MQLNDIYCFMLTGSLVVPLSLEEKPLSYGGTGSDPVTGNSSQPPLRKRGSRLRTEDFVSEKIPFLCKIIILLLPIIGTAQPIQQLTLNDFLNLAKEKSIQKDIAETEYQIAQLDYDIYQAQLKPRVDAFVNFPNYAKSFREIIQPSGTVAFQPIRNNNAYVSLFASQPLQRTGGSIFLQTDLQRFDDFEGDTRQYNGLPIRLGIRQPLFQFNPWKWQKKVAPLRQREATKKRIFDLATIEVEATSIFFRLLIAHQDLIIAQTNQKNNEELLVIAEERFALGKISQNDLLQLSLEKVSATKSKRAAVVQVRIASAAIYNYLGVPFSGELIEVFVPTDFPLLTITEQEALEKALQNNYLLDNYIRQQVEAERDLEESQKNAGLNMDLSASIGYSRSANVIGDIYSSPQQEQLLQIGIQLPIINWGQEKAVIQQKQLQLDLVQKQNERLRNQLITNIKQVLYRINDLKEQLALSKEQQEIAIQRFEIARQSFVLGAISATELGIAQQEKDFALRDYILTLSNYWSSYFAFRQSTLIE